MVEFSSVLGLSLLLSCLADYVPRLVFQSKTRLVAHISSPGAEDVKGGFEGGTAVETHDGKFHIFTTEQIVSCVQTRLAHWQSSALTGPWTRVATLYNSSGNFDGTDPRAALWAPMPATEDPLGERWSLFYVACLG